MKRVQKRGQAAMEFLMTYGWALLVVLIAIGALAFFGVLNPSRFLPQQCVLGPGLACADFKVTSVDQKVQITVQNGLGEDLKQFQIYVDNVGGKHKCGGYYGYVAFYVNSASRSPPLRDGSAEKLINLFNGNGIQCGGGVNNCCTDFKKPPLGLYPYDLCPSITSCYAGEPQWKVGEKFSEDIVITYQTEGSQILHQRVGRLTTQIE